MDVNINTSDPDSVDPKEIFEAIEAAGYLVVEVNVNDGERLYNRDGRYRLS